MTIRVSLLPPNQAPRTHNRDLDDDGAKAVAQTLLLPQCTARTMLNSPASASNGCVTKARGDRARLFTVWELGARRVDFNNRWRLWLLQQLGGFDMDSQRSELEESEEGSADWG
jgi:hypothetical protein